MPREGREGWLDVGVVSTWPVRTTPPTRVYTYTHTHPVPASTDQGGAYPGVQQGLAQVAGASLGAGDQGIWVVGVCDTYICVDGMDG